MSGRSVGRGGCTRVSHSSVECDGKEYQLGELLDPHAGEFWAYLLTYGALVLFTGLMSGLTMGLLSLDIMSLEILKRGGKTHQQRYAARILQLVRRHHLLLVTLLLANAVAVESMPIFLAKITTEVVAVIVSVIAVLVFGEVVPQAICTRFGLAIGYYMLCSSCVSFASSILPPGLPHCPPPGQNPREGPQHFLQESRAEELGSKTHDNEEPLSSDEVVEAIMTPLESVFMLSYDAYIDEKVMDNIKLQGHSRVPVYKGERDNIVGMLLVKRLIHLDPEDCTPVTDLEGANTSPPSCATTTPLFDLLNKFQTGRSHLYLVYKEGEDGSSESQLVGIITLEDVIEELIGKEIVDETDVYVDVHK